MGIVADADEPDLTANDDMTLFKPQENTKDAMRQRKQTLMHKLIKKDKKVQYNTLGLASLKHFPEPDKFPSKMNALLNQEEQMLAGRRSACPPAAASAARPT